MSVVHWSDRPLTCGQGVDRCSRWPLEVSVAADFLLQHVTEAIRRQVADRLDGLLWESETDGGEASETESETRGIRPASGWCLCW